MKKLFPLYFIIFFASCKQSKNHATDGIDTNMLRISAERPLAKGNDTLKDYGITVDSMHTLLSRGVRPATIAEQKQFQKQVFVEDWQLRTDADFNKRIEVAIKNGDSMHDNIVAIRITLKGDSCNFDTVLQNKVNIKPGNRFTLSKKIGNVNCEKINVSKAECVMENGHVEIARIHRPLPIEKFLTEKEQK